LLGIAIAGLWGFSELKVAHGNENLLQANPIALILAATVWGSMVDRPRARWLALVLAGLSLAGFLLKPLPGFDQANATILMLTVPGHLGLAWGIWLWSDPHHAIVVASDVKDHGAVNSKIR
jgi:hypothetical protein